MRGLPKIHRPSIPSLTLLTPAFAPSPRKSIMSSIIQDLLLGANCSMVQEVDTIMTILTFIKYLSSLPLMNSNSPQRKPSSDQAVGLRILHTRTTVLLCTLTTSSVSCVRIWSQRCGRRCRSHSGKIMGSTEVSWLKGLSLTCLIADGEVIAFPTIVRDEKLLAEERPILVLRFDNGRQGITNALMRLPTAKHVSLIPIDTAVFAYEPILAALQMKRTLPLEREILFFKGGMTLDPPTHHPKAIVAAIKAAPTQDLQRLLDTPAPINLDQAQADALVNALSQRVALIQGPPGMCNVHRFVIF